MNPRCVKTSSSYLSSNKETLLLNLPVDLQHESALQLIELALAEDLSSEADFSALGDDITQADVTSAATLSENQPMRARIFAKEPGVVAGLPIARAVFALVSPETEFANSTPDGSRVTDGQLLASATGPGRELLVAERTAINFLGRLSGVSTLTRRFVDALAGTATKILDTRKTTPGFRLLDKYAVRMGGGENHRMGLFDMALVKENHIDGAGGLKEAVERVRMRYGDSLPIEVEVKDLAELELALTLPVNRIMLDNMDLETTGQAVQITAGRIPLEASGNMTLERVRSVANTGVDYISVGALTHSARVLDISMRMNV